MGPRTCRQENGRGSGRQEPRRSKGERHQKVPTTITLRGLARDRHAEKTSGSQRSGRFLLSGVQSPLPSALLVRRAVCRSFAASFQSPSGRSARAILVARNVTIDGGEAPRLPSRSTRLPPPETRRGRLARRGTIQPMRMTGHGLIRKASLACCSAASSTSVLV